MKIRAHHLFCIQGFQGHGYSNSFVNYLRDLKKMLYNDNPVICIIYGCDDLCENCPNFANGICTKYGSEVDDMDKDIINMLGISAGSNLRYKDALNKISEKYRTLDDIDKICGKCRWKKVCLFYLSYINQLY